MEYGIKVGDIMTRSLVSVTPKTNLQECAKLIIKKRVGGLIVLEKEKLKGVVTEKDIIWAIVKKSKKDLKDIKASDLMKRRVITIKPSADIIEAMRRLRKHKIRRLPVLEYGNVIGIITMKDILKIDPGLFKMVVESIKIKEQTKKIKASDKAIKGCGICEDCGEYDLLNNDAGQSLCENCYAKR